MRLVDLPALDCRELTDEQLDQLDSVFDDFEYRTLLPAHEAWRDPVRQALDGAVMLGPNGQCHAFGVILDGEAIVGKGDPARGSRYNSAVRYQRTKALESMLVVISDDGTVDLVPDLMPRVCRQEVEAAVNAFCAASEREPVDGEEFARTHDQVTEFAFYLDDEQCQRVNEAYETEMRRRDDAGGVTVSTPRLQAHPDMKPSYFY